MIRLWTLQTEAAYRRLMGNGCLVADPNLCDPSFERPYKWMLEQMRHRLPTIEPLPTAAIWAWARWHPPMRCRPDLRARGHAPPGEPSYRIEIEVNPKDFLLSDYNLWHHVLNYWYVASCQDDSDQFDANYNVIRFGWDCLPPKQIHKLIAASWERIFDFDWWDDYVTGPPSKRPIQGTLWCIDPATVRDVQRFVGR